MTCVCFPVSFLQHASFLVEAFKLVLGIWENNMVCNICFEILRFPSYLLVFYVGRARPRAYLNRRWADRRPGQNQGVRGYVAS